MHRSEITIDLGAVRRNVRRLRSALGRSELWAVVKADGYGHGAVDVGGAALGEGALALCVATVGEALPLRREFPGVRILVMGPTSGREIAQAREADLDIVVTDDAIPQGVRVHLKLDTGMGRWGLSELPEPPVEVVGLMTHLGDGGLGTRSSRAPRSPVSRRRRWLPAPHPARREQRRGAPPSRVPFRCGAVRDRALRAVAVRRGTGGGRSRACAALG